MVNLDSHLVSREVSLNRQIPKLRISSLPLNRRKQSQMDGMMVILYIHQYQRATIGLIFFLCLTIISGTHLKLWSGIFEF